MREIVNIGERVIIALVTGAGLVALASGASLLLPPSGLLDTLGGWPMLAALVALLCGVCALSMSLALRWSTGSMLRLIITGLVGSAITWGACLAAATSRIGWARTLASWPELVQARPALAAVGGAVIAWLLFFAALTGLLAGHRQTSATRRALTPLWLAPLWGAGVGLAYGLFNAFIFYIPPCPPRYHCYSLDTTPWDGMRAGLGLGVGAGLLLGLTLALSLRLALALCPAPRDDLVAPHAIPMRPSGA